MSRSFLCRRWPRVLLLPFTAGAQTPATPQPGTPATPSVAVAPALSRWFELQNATLNLRYRFIDTTAGVTTTNQLQHRETIRGRVKFDKAAKYTWNFGVFTGTRFTSGWDNTGWGLADAQKNFAFKASYLSAIPVQGIEAQYGGFYLLRGESTELTTYDEDGYLIGQRISVKRPAELFLDEISVTVGYLDADPSSIPISRAYEVFERHAELPALPCRQEAWKTGRHLNRLHVPRTVQKHGARGST